MTQVLIVEDDAALRTAIIAALEPDGYQIDAAKDGRAATALLSEARYDVVLLDIGLPFVSGWHILEQTSTAKMPAVIVISARGQEHDKVRALDMGADDYLAKPFGADELRARIRAVIRRSQPAPSPLSPVNVGRVVIDLANRSVWRGGVEVRLSPTEYGLLAHLARHAGEVLEHRNLLTEVWGSSHAYERNYLRTFIQRLRRKLEDDPSHPTLIVTAGNRGYRLNRL
jgi:two-component system KDP operon response regulator KdpE